MPRIKFSKSYEHPLNSIETKCFDAGWEGEVSDEIAAKAIKLRVAVEVAAPVTEPDGPTPGEPPRARSVPKGKAKPASEAK